MQTELDRPVATEATITVDRDALVAGISKIKQVVDAKHKVPVLQNLHFLADHDMMTVSGTDMDMLFAVDLPCHTSAPIAFTVSAALLAAATDTMRPGEITMVRSAGIVQLKAKGSTRRLPTLGADGFPAISAGDALSEFDIDGAQLLAMLEGTQACACSDEARFFMHGVHLHAIGNQIAAAATDGHRMAQVVAPIPVGANSMPPVTITMKGVRLMMSLLADPKPDGTVHVSITDKKIQILRGRYRLIAKLAEGGFPDYRRFIPTGNGQRFAVHAAELNRCIRAAAALTDGKTRGIRLDLGPDGCTASGIASEGQSAVEPIDGEYGPGTIRIGVNSSYAIDALKSFGDTSQLEIDILGDAVPMLIRSPDRPAVTVVMGLMRA
jgi:DNA polymerase-3 subunit beta